MVHSTDCSPQGIHTHCVQHPQSSGLQGFPSKQNTDIRNSEQPHHRKQLEFLQDTPGLLLVNTQEHKTQEQKALSSKHQHNPEVQTESVHIIPGPANKSTDHSQSLQESFGADLSAAEHPLKNTSSAIKQVILHETSENREVCNDNPMVTGQLELSKSIHAPMAQDLQSAEGNSPVRQTKGDLAPEDHVSNVQAATPVPLEEAQGDHEVMLQKNATQTADILSSEGIVHPSACGVNLEIAQERKSELECTNEGGAANILEDKETSKLNTFYTPNSPPSALSLKETATLEQTAGHMGTPSEEVKSLSANTSTQDGLELDGIEVPEDIG